MTYLEFREKLFELGCFRIQQVYAWQPDFDRNNLGFTLGRSGVFSLSGISPSTGFRTVYSQPHLSAFLHQSAYGTLFLRNNPGGCRTDHKRHLAQDGNIQKSIWGVLLQKYQA